MPKLFITISPPPRSTKLIFLYMDDLLHIHSSLKGIKRYIIYPELDPRGRLHYHGIINCNDHEYVTYYKSSKQKLKNIGYIDERLIGSFKENLRTVIYIQKEWGRTKDILNIDHPILPPKKVKLSENKDKSMLDYGINQNTLLFYGFTLTP